MKKIFANLFIIICILILSAGISAQDTKVTLYAPDGRTIEISDTLMSDYIALGWYTRPVTTLYSVDGRTATVAKSEAEAYLNVGWYKQPVTVIYALNGKTAVVAKSEAKAYLELGWYKEPVTVIYAPGGKTAVIAKSETNSYLELGWYKYPVTVVYAINGKSLTIPTAQLSDYESVGWYKKPVTTIHGTDDKNKVVFTEEAAPKDTIEENLSKSLDEITETTSFALDFKCVLQNPELPTGCEVTALTAVLNYYGFPINKTTLANRFLDKGPVGSTSPYDAFIGNPTTSNSYGCFAPVIVKCANKYLSSQNSALKAYNTTGTELEHLFTEVANGYPVIIWATMYMKASYLTSTWNINGENIRWIANEHCMVLYGYDKSRQVVKVADPLVGNKEYSLSLFEKRFKELLMQSVIIK